MNLHTTCPHCRTLFRITEQQLAAADGWTQCGVCAAPFDALAGLPEDERTLYLTPPAPEPEVLVEAPIAEPIAPPAEARQEVATAPPTAEVPAAAPPPKESEPQTSAPAGPHLPGLDRRIAEEAAQAQGTHPADLPSIIILDPDVKVSEEYGPLPVIPDHASHGEGALELEDDDEDEGEADVAGPTAATIVSRPIPSESMLVPAPAQTSRRAGWAWIVVPLLLLLLGQLIYFLRDSLTTNYPGLRPALASVCEIIGCKLGLPQDVEQIKILGSDLQAEPGNAKRMTLALTLANRASYPQAWPMLRLSLTDTRDKPLARRVFAPSEYLSRSGMLEAGIPALSETPLSLHLETRDVNASGFRVEVFY